MSLVIVKSPTENNLRTLDISSLLGVGETVSTVSLDYISPGTSPSLTVSDLTVSGFTVSLRLNGGHESVSYGVKLLLVLSSNRSVDLLLAVVVRTELNLPYSPDTALSVPSLLGEIRSGESGIGSVSFTLGPGLTNSNLHILWDLVSPDGHIVSTGNCYDVIAIQNQFSTVIRGDAVVHVPSSAAPSEFDRKYTLRWTLFRPGQPDINSFEHLSVTGLTSAPLGVQDCVELQGDIASMSITLPELYEVVTLDVFSGVGNHRLAGPVSSTQPRRVGSGWYYQVNVDTNSLPAALEPFICSWKYFHSATPGTNYRETSRLFVLNPSMMNAVEDARATVNRARATLFNFADMVFDTNTLVSFLRRGMDMFNAAGGIWTGFDMTDATGGVRDYWIGYSEVAMLQAQALAEGEKAFDFQGQAIQLTVDRTQYYNQLAQDTLSRLDTNVRPFKQSLQNKGVTGGSGNVSNVKGNSARVGISIHPASQFGRAWGGLGRIR